MEVVRPLDGDAVTLLLSVLRREHRTSLTANLGCWHALPMSISAMLTLAPGCSPWRLRSALAASRLRKPHFDRITVALFLKYIACFLEPA